MASPVYTKHLWSVTSGSAGTTPGPGPLPGFRWVVTDVEGWNAAEPHYIRLGGFTVTDVEGYPIANCTPLVAQAEFEYRWQGRQVVDYPDHLELVAQEGGWLVRITGFELTLP